MTASTVDRIESDTTAMTECSDCASPLDFSGRPAAADYIHRVEGERQDAEDLTTQILMALEPFAAMANRYGTENPDCTVVMTWQDKPVVTLGDLRRAKHFVDLY
jgi:hypothetical protein